MEQAKNAVQLHTIPPVWDGNSRMLILGSFPSVASRAAEFYYAHPQNRFWRVLAGVFGTDIPETVEQKRHLLLSHGLALWDVIASCRITGSADSSVTDVVPNDLAPILSQAPIARVLLNGQTAAKYYRRFDLPRGFPEPIILPSTSPANAAWSAPRLTAAWQRAIL